MVAKKRLSKSQLRDDKFIDTVAHYAGQLREHQRSIIGGLAGILIVIFASSWGVRYFRESNTESQVAFAQALSELESAVTVNMPDGYQSALQSFQSIRGQFGGKKAGHWALYYTGFCKEQLKDYQGALADYESYLDEDSGGEFSLAAEEGRASCMNNLGKSRAAAELLEELASRPGASETRARQWLYRASQIYLSGQYYENSQAALEKLETMGAGLYEKKVARDLAALRAMRS